MSLPKVEQATAAPAAEDEDEDVLWEGSPLHQHLEREGILLGQEEDLTTRTSPTEAAPLSRRRPCRRPPPTSKGLCARWPESDLVAAQLEVEVARRLLDSELLVQEDEEFVNNFILTEEAVEMARKSQEVHRTQPGKMYF